MRMVMVAIDTRGGVVPYGALGAALAWKGHEVAVAAPADLVGVLPPSVSGIALKGGMQEAIEALGSTEGVLRAPRDLRQQLGERTASAVRTILDEAGPIDVVLAGVGGSAAAEAVAVARGARLLAAHLQPIGPAATEYPGVLAPPALRRGPFARWLGHQLTARMAALPIAGTRRVARAAARVDPRARPRTVPGAVYGYSSRVVPRAASWPIDRVVTGYWRLSDDEPPLDPALEAFLDHHDRPLVAGFGSMRARDPLPIARALVDVAARLDLPLVVLTGWNGPFPLQNLPDTVHVATAAPHDRLFRRAAVVVHHGGAGTTGASLTAGAPTVVLPFAADQAFWGGRVHAIGAGPKPIPVQDLTAQRLRSAVEAALDDRMVRTVNRIAAALRSEDGPSTGAEAVERLTSAGSQGASG